ncbi:hypothetical protein PO124_06200 [Bacillus licheniformis]|nr:hypothetical protein [Bacillus licheniformis]
MHMHRGFNVSIPLKKPYNLSLSLFSFNFNQYFLIINKQQAWKDFNLFFHSPLSCEISILETCSGNSFLNPKAHHNKPLPAPYARHRKKDELEVAVIGALMLLVRHDVR